MAPGRAGNGFQATAPRRPIGRNPLVQVSEVVQCGRQHGYDPIDGGRREALREAVAPAAQLIPEDDFRKYAAAGAAVLGDSAEITAHRCKRGDFFFYGAAGSAIFAWALVQVRVSPLWLILAALVIGWYLNERERKRIKAEIAARRS